MSNQQHDTEASQSSDCPRHIDPIQKISARSAEIGGGITVNRVLPSRQRRMIGAWCFLDHAGPAVFRDGTGMKVGPHPHIGLQTFTWMVAGEVLHRDSLGNVAEVRPGEVNLMTAGRGISHTEESLAGSEQLHAAQLWIALPYQDRECEPAFDHYPELPVWRQGDSQLTLLAGRYAGEQSPAKIYSPLLAVDIVSASGDELYLPLDTRFEYGILVLQGDIVVCGQRFVENDLAYFSPGANEVQVTLSPNSQIIFLGGEPFAGDITLWWNFVGHSRAEITQAQRDWEAGSSRFGSISGFDGAPLIAPPLPWRE